MHDPTEYIFGPVIDGKQQVIGICQATGQQVEKQFKWIGPVSPLFKHVFAPNWGAVLRYAKSLGKEVKTSHWKSLVKQVMKHGNPEMDVETLKTHNGSGLIAMSMDVPQNPKTNTSPVQAKKEKAVASKTRKEEAAKITDAKLMFPYYRVGPKDKLGDKPAYLGADRLLTELPKLIGAHKHFRCIPVAARSESEPPSLIVCRGMSEKGRNVDHQDYNQALSELCDFDILGVGVSLSALTNGGINKKRASAARKKNITKAAKNAIAAVEKAVKATKPQELPIPTV